MPYWPSIQVHTGSTAWESSATAAYNHSAEAAFDDAVLGDGAALYAELALRRLAAAG